MNKEYKKIINSVTHPSILLITFLLKEGFFFIKNELLMNM